MKEEKIKAVKVAPGEKPEVVELENNLDALQKAVSEGAAYQGLIEVLPNYDVEGTLFILNEEGKLIGLEANRRYYDDVFVGTFYICGENEDGDFASLTDEQVKEAMAQFEEVETFSDFRPESGFAMGFYF